MSRTILEQMACTCGCGFGAQHEHVDTSLLSLLTWLEAELGRRLAINSGCRCTEQNARVGGSPNSAHQRGRAADVGVENDRERAMLVEAAVKWGCRRIEHGAFYVHVDVDHTLPQPWHGFNFRSLETRARLR